MEGFLRRTILSQLLVILILLTFSCSSVFAVGSAGFENASLGARSNAQGNAFVAAGDDPSVIAFNAAEMTEVPGTQVTLGDTVITPFPVHQGTGSIDVERASVQTFNTPNSFITTDTHTKRVFLGFGYTAPFGLATRYGSESYMKYIGYSNKFEFQGFSPAMALKVTPWLSVGGGATYYSANIEQIVKLKQSGVGGAHDAKMWLDLPGEGWGWNGGILVKPHPKHRIGVNYRSLARIRYKGGLTVEGIDGAYTGIFGGNTFYTNVNSDIILPPAVTVGYAFLPTDRLKFETDISWVGWSTYDRLEFDIAHSNAVLDALTPISEDYHDTINVHFGTEYKLTNEWKLRAGYLFYQTPVEKANFSPTNPDSSRNAVSVGLGYERQAFAVNLSYMAMFYAKRKISNDVGASSQSNVDGTYKNFVNIVGVNFTYKFDQNLN
jgi:long-chain fatty acid transport protein